MQSPGVEGSGFRGTAPYYMSSFGTTPGKTKPPKKIKQLRHITSDEYMATYEEEEEDKAQQKKAQLEKAEKNERKESRTAREEERIKGRVKERTPVGDPTTIRSGKPPDRQRTRRR